MSFICSSLEKIVDSIVAETDRSFSFVVAVVHLDTYHLCLVVATDVIGGREPLRSPRPDCFPSSGELISKFELI